MSSVMGLWIRIFSGVDRDWLNIKIDEDQKIIHVRSLEDIGRKKNPNNLYWQFKVHEILQNVSQDFIFRSIFTNDIKEKIFEGFDLTLFAFGSSGTGKTYTLSGLDTKFENRGIISRLLEFLFDTKKAGHFYEINISLTYVEIAGKNIFNLLQKGKPKIDKAVEPTEVKSLCEALKLIFKGNCQRKIENMNTHCGTSILTVLVSKGSRSSSDPIVTKSKVHIIDTAGIEFARKSNKSMKCHNDSNLTKCYLNTICSWAICDLTERTPNWRTSKLASYLGKSLQNGHMRFLGHVAVSTASIPETISTLLFGTRLMNLPCPKLVQAKIREPNAIIKHLQEQITDLKGTRAVDAYQLGIYRPEVVSQNQMKHAIQLVKSFLNSEVTDTCIAGIAHTQILIKIFKDIYNSMLNEMKLIKDDFQLLRNEHDAWLQKGTEIDRIRSSRKRASSTSLRSKRKGEGKKKSGVSRTPDDADITSLVPTRIDEDNPNGSRPNYDYSTLPLESEESGEKNFHKTFNEVISINIHNKMKINVYKEDIEENYRIKNQAMKEMLDIRQKLNNIHITLEDEQWKSKLNPPEEKYNRNGKCITKSAFEERLEAEEQELQRKFFEVRQTAINAHNTYMAAKRALSDEISSAEALHCEYSQKICNSSLILPPIDAFSGIIKMSDDQNKINIEAKKCYEALQEKGPRTIGLSLNKEK